MTDEDVKKLRELIKEEVRAVKDIVEVVKHKVDTQQMFQSNTADNIRLIKEQQSIINEKLDEHTKKLGRLEDKADALTGDVMELQDQTKAVWDKIALGHTRNKREIDEIKRHLDLPSMPDVPEV